MKPMIRLVAIALVALASFTTLPSAAKARALAPPTCASFCSIVFCPGSQTCGLTATGCACHD
jgi:hypothetical protein